MVPQSIHLFMWGYQPQFRILFEGLMNDVLERLGVSEPGVKCFLVGARIPGAENQNSVCIETEDGKWNVGFFDGLLDLIEQEFVNHPSPKIFYSDASSMQDKSENIRRDSVRLAVQKMLKGYDSKKIKSSHSLSRQHL